MKATGVGQTDVGQKRENNEDAFGVDDDHGVYVVADGMGGHQGGEVASQMSVDIVARELAKESTARTGNSVGDAELVEAITKAIRAANAAVLERAQAEPDLEKMGCALTALLCVGDRAVMGHVGDTRLYRRRNGEITQLSDDHTFVGELVRAGTVPAEQMHRHPHAHVLTRALGAQDDVEVDAVAFELRPGDRFLLCSDGLTAYFEDPETLNGPLSVDDFRSIPASVVRVANDSGGRDNITVVVVDVA